MNAWRRLNLTILLAALTVLGLVVLGYRLANPPPHYPELTALEAARAPGRMTARGALELHKAFPMIDQTTLLRIAAMEDPGQRHEALKAAQQAAEAGGNADPGFSLLPDSVPEPEETSSKAPAFTPGLPAGTGRIPGQARDPFATACGTVEECDPYPEEDPLAVPLYLPPMDDGQPADAEGEPEN